MSDPREERRAALEARRGEPITLDALTGTWSILQRKRGHRHSTDDVLTAYHALVHGPRTDAALDLGTGIGTVGLMVLHGLGPDATLTCVEAQEVSYALLLENLALNGLTDRVFRRAATCAKCVSSAASTSSRGARPTST
ncbi:MAG: methyltransferase [Sandaracinus sp.]|nr:methyltransferase [Sandaracinus sp.]